MEGMTQPTNREKDSVELHLRVDGNLVASGDELLPTAVK